MTSGAGDAADDQTKQDSFPAGLQPWATMTPEEVWQPLLSGVLQEFDHRVDLTRHGKLLEQVIVTTLISAEQVVLAIQQENRSAGRMSSTLESGRELATVAYDLAAFTNSDGPYTLNEIYQTFSFCDKIQSIQDHATKELQCRLHVPGLFRSYDPKALHADQELWTTCSTMLNGNDEVTGKAEDGTQQLEADEAEDELEESQDVKERRLRARWKPPNREEMILFLRAGVRPNHVNDSGQTLLMLACRAACLCVCESEDPDLQENPDGSQVYDQDAAFAETVGCLCEEAPSTWSMEDPSGRTPLVVFAEVFGASSPSVAPMATLKAFLAGLSVCFSKAPSSIIWALRCNDSLRNAAESLSRFFIKEQLPLPTQLTRLLLWMEVVMGGAWEVSEDQRHLTERLLMDSVTLDIEDMMDTAIRLREFCEQMEKKVEQWEAEEAELKLAEFEARCAKKASQYEDRIARLEAEIARRAGNLQLLPQLQLSPQEVEEKEDAHAETEIKSEEKPKQKPVVKPQGRVLEEAKQVVEEIRADRLVNSGWDEGISEEVKSGLLAMRRSLCAAVERLAMDLYADECHCLWELMQNADDNKYADESVIPELTLALEVDEEHGAYVWTSNNEVGLSSEDVQAICNVNASLKGAGQTGHKGIGWKSVFRISDCPHVLSNAFAFKFDTRGPLGKLALVTPTNLSDEEVEALPAPVREAKAAGNTVMFLPLRSKSDALAVDVELHHIAAQHLCLAFLRRLRRVRLRFVEGSMILQRSEADLAKLYFPGASNLVAVKITEFTEAGEKRTQMPEYVLHHHDVALPGETVALTLAFPVAFALDTTQGSEEDEELFKAPLQPLFTFLPVKVVGFRFAIQGPFDLTADRGNLHGKSQRNRSLCASVPLAFQAALQSLPGLRSRALDLLGQETPEATWLLVRGQLLEVLKEVECVPTEPDGQLARPGECLLPAEEPKLAEAMQHLPSDVLWDQCQRRLVQRQWALRHRAQTQGLGIEEFGIDQWLQVLGVYENESNEGESGESGESGERRKRSLAEVAAEKEDHAFFKRLYPLLGTALSDKPEVLERLRQVPLLLDSAGNAFRVSDGPAFSCYASDVPKGWQKKLEAAGALRVLSDKVHSGLEPVGHRFLRQLGVSRLTRHSIVPLCASWHLSLADANFQSGGSSGSTAVPRPAEDTADPEPKGVADNSSDTFRCAVWASLACLRQHFLTGATGIPSSERNEEVPWSDLGQLLVPSSSLRRGFGPCARLTCPSYLGEAAGSELQQDVLVAIMGFIYGVEAEVRDIGVFADAPPSWLREEKEASKSEVTDKLNWEAFLDALGMKPLSPCTFHRKVAGTVLTIDLGWRLSSCDWWREVCASSTALGYVERRLKNADRVELTWLRQLRTPERVDVSELFLRNTYVRYGGHFLPYMDLSEESQALGCLQRLQVVTELNGPGLRKCLRVLQLRRCHDISVFADLYAALQALPKAEQVSTNSWGTPEKASQFQVFLPPSSFEVAQNCLWTDDGRSIVRWLCGYHVLQSEYGRFGSACRSWLVGPHVGVRQDLNSLQASDFLKALRSLVQQADIASRMPVEERQKRLEGRDSPSAAIFLEELQSTAVHAYKYLAKCCTIEHDEERSRANGTTALAFQHEALIVLTDKDWPKPKRLKTHEAFWDVHPDLASSKAAKLALKGRFPPDDLDLLKKFFVDVVGIPESLTQQDLEARLRVPLSQEQQPQSSWQEGFGLADFEDFATVRRGPGVLGPGAGEEDFFRPADDLPGGLGSSSVGSSGYQNQSGGHAAQPGSSSVPASSSSHEAASSVPTTEGGTSRQDDAAGEATTASGGTEPAVDALPVPSEEPAEAIPEEPEEEDDFDWDGEDANDPYKVLRVENDASDDTIKRAYKKLALKYHPDKNRGSELAQRRFQVIAAAYETLRDPERRRAYDEAAAARKYARQEQDPPAPEWKPKVSAERAREMFQSFFGDRETASEAPPQRAPTARMPPAGGPRPADSSRAADSSRSSRASASSGKHTLSKEEYQQLLDQLKEAEETAKMWNEEVEVARQQLQEAEETRDRYLRILQECYDRTSSRS